MPVNLFNETQVEIPDNPVLQKAANMILQSVEANPDVLKGETVGEIDRNLLVEIWLTHGLADILTPDQVDRFKEWLKGSVNIEAVRRARQWLVQHDYIRLPASALRDAERQRHRLTDSFRSK